MPGAATHSCKEFAFKVIENDRSGNYILEAELIAASQKSESDGRVFVFDSDSLQNISFNTTASLDLLAILHRPFTVILSPKGEVIRVEGMKELGRSEERRVGKECVSTCRSRGSPYQ